MRDMDIQALFAALPPGMVKQLQQRLDETSIDATDLMRVKWVLEDIVTGIKNDFSPSDATSELLDLFPDAVVSTIFR